MAVHHGIGQLNSPVTCNAEFQQFDPCHPYNIVLVIIIINN